MSGELKLNLRMPVLFKQNIEKRWPFFFPLKLPRPQGTVWFLFKSQPPSPYGCGGLVEVWVGVHMCMHVCVHMCMRMCVHTCMCVCVHMGMCVCMWCYEHMLYARGT